MIGATRIEWPGGYAELHPIPQGCDRATRRRLQKLAATDFAKIGRQAAPLVEKGAPSIAYRDAGKLRDLVQAEAELVKLADADRTAEHRGRYLFDTYQIVATNGHFAWCQSYLGQARKPTYRTADLIARLTPADWRTYATVRAATAANNAVHERWITWTAAPDFRRLTWYARHEEAEARAWIDLPDGKSAEAIVKLQDRYVWPLRGLAWDVLLTRPADGVPAVVFRHGSIAVVIATAIEARAAAKAVVMGRP